MSGILYDATKIKVCEAFYAICDYAELPRAFSDGLWMDILTAPSIYEELVYYIEHHTFMDKVKIEGFSLSDLYVFQMDKYNLIRESGKNPVTCNKEKIAMRAFRTLLDMQKAPEEYVRRLKEGRGEDRL